jgi:acetyl-CoA acetyltransferase
MLDAYIYDGLRTAFGRHAGALAPVRPDDLVAGVMKTLVARSPWQPGRLKMYCSAVSPKPGKMRATSPAMPCCWRIFLSPFPARR